MIVDQPHMPAPAPPDAKPVPTVAEVVKTHGTFVVRSLRYLGVDESDVEDAAQEVFLVVFKRLAEFAGQSKLQTWLYGICLRIASARRRRVFVRRESLTSQPPDTATPPQQDQDLDRARRRSRLIGILDQLDDDKRAVFVLYEIEHLPMREVAEAIGCPLQTAYYRHQAARRQVLEALACDPAEEGK